MTFTIQILRRKTGSILPVPLKSCLLNTLRTIKAVPKRNGSPVFRHYTAGPIFPLAQLHSRLVAQTILSAHCSPANLPSHFSFYEARHVL